MALLLVVVVAVIVVCMLYVHAPSCIIASADRGANFKFLGACVTDDLTWTLHSDQHASSTHQRLYFLSRLKKLGLPHNIFSRRTTESILCGCITVRLGRLHCHPSRGPSERDKGRLSKLQAANSEIWRTPTRHAA